MTNSNLKERLKAARKAASLTQKEVADLAGISQPTYSDLESGNHSGSKHIVRICQVLRVDPSFILFGEERPSSEALAGAINSLPDGSREIVENLVRALIEKG